MAIGIKPMDMLIDLIERIPRVSLGELRGRFRGPQRCQKADPPSFRSSSAPLSLFPYLREIIISLDLKRTKSATKTCAATGMEAEYETLEDDLLSPNPLLASESVFGDLEDQVEHVTRSSVGDLAAFLISKSPDVILEALRSEHLRGRLPLLRPFRTVHVEDAISKELQ